MNFDKVIDEILGEIEQQKARVSQLRDEAAHQPLSEKQEVRELISLRLQYVLKEKVNLQAVYEEQAELEQAGEQNSCTFNPGSNISFTFNKEHFIFPRVSQFAKIEEMNEFAPLLRYLFENSPILTVICEACPQIRRDTYFLMANYFQAEYSETKMPQRYFPSSLICGSFRQHITTILALVLLYSEESDFLLDPRLLDLASSLAAFPSVKQWIVRAFYAVFEKYSEQRLIDSFANMFSDTFQDLEISEIVKDLLQRIRHAFRNVPDVVKQVCDHINYLLEYYFSQEFEEQQNITEVMREEFKEYVSEMQNRQYSIFVLEVLFYGIKNPFLFGLLSEDQFDSSQSGLEVSNLCFAFYILEHMICAIEPDIGKELENNGVSLIAGGLVLNATNMELFSQNQYRLLSKIQEECSFTLAKYVYDYDVYVLKSQENESFEGVRISENIFSVDSELLGLIINLLIEQESPLKELGESTLEVFGQVANVSKLDYEEVNKIITQLPVQELFDKIGYNECGAVIAVDEETTEFFVDLYKQTHDYESEPMKWYALFETAQKEVAQLAEEYDELFINDIELEDVENLELDIEKNEEIIQKLLKTRSEELKESQEFCVAITKLEQKLLLTDNGDKFQDYSEDEDDFDGSNLTIQELAFEDTWKHIVEQEVLEKEGIMQRLYEEYEYEYNVIPETLKRVFQ